MNEALTIWKMDQKLASANKKNKHAPFVEDILSGYSDFQKTISRYQIENLSSKVKQIEITLPSEAQVIYLIPKKNPTQILVSLHGGPEGYEGTEIRYLGLYRELLKAGYAIAILNYRGSTKIKANQKSAWKNWKNSILTDFKELSESIKCRLPSININLLGASFGGALALIIAQNFAIEKCVLFSPLLDLRTQKERGAENYTAWFASRFGDDDYSDFSFETLSKKSATKILIFCADRDEVLGNKMNRKLKKLAPKNMTVISQITTHAPKTFAKSFKRLNVTYDWLLNRS